MRAMYGVCWQVSQVSQSSPVFSPVLKCMYVSSQVSGEQILVTSWKKIVQWKKFAPTLLNHINTTHLSPVYTWRIGAKIE